MNKLPANWKEVKLKDALNDYIRGPFGSALKRNELLNKGIAVYEQQHAIYNTRNFRYFIDKNKYEQLKRFTVFENDLIISCSGTLGKVSIIKENDTFGIISQALLLLRPNINIVYPKYLYYYFFSNIGYNALLSRSTGSVQINIAKRKDIENIKLNLPPLAEQKRIASILSSLDDKIELNNKTNRILEDMAQSIFNEWFINFNFPNEDGKPYKKSGGEMIDSELGKIPKGWKVITLKDIVNIVKGKKPNSTNNKITDKFTMPYLTIDCYNNEKTEYTEYNEKMHVKELDIVMVMDGNAGKIFYGKDGILSSTMAKLVVEDENLNEIVFNFLKSIEYDLMYHTVGSVIPHADKQYMLNKKFCVPENNLERLSDIFKDIRNKVSLNKKENEKLSGIRDILLPKLMSGDIKV